jgi:hypothetical protein
MFPIIFAILFILNIVFYITMSFAAVSWQLSLGKGWQKTRHVIGICTALIAVAAYVIFHIGCIFEKQWMCDAFGWSVLTTVVIISVYIMCLSLHTEIVARKTIKNDLIHNINTVA